LLAYKQEERKQIGESSMHLLGYLKE
jgi:hypothetical protein